VGKSSISFELTAKVAAAIPAVALAASLSFSGYAEPGVISEPATAQFGDVKPLANKSAIDEATNTAVHSLDEVSSCVKANLPETTLSQDVSMQTFDRSGGSRTLEGKLYARREDGKDRLMMAIKAPVDLAGVRYLLREMSSRDDMQMYLPALDRTRRISGSRMNETALFGTDFSYEDIKQLTGGFAKGAGELLGPETHKGRPVWKLKLNPAAEKESAYSEIISWVDQQSCTVLATDFVVAGQGVVKKLSADIESIQQTGKRWYVGKYRMDDVKAETHTIMVIEDAEFDENLSPRLFNPKTFQRG